MAVEQGADEVDIVLALNHFLVGEYDQAAAEIVAVRQAVDRVAASQGRKVILKVILETGLLQSLESIAAASFLAMEAGADFIKTSTGFSTGGATVEDVKLFRQHISPDLRIKAAGGIRSFEQAQAMLDAGAERIGASALAALMEE